MEGYPPPKYLFIVCHTLLVDWQADYTMRRKAMSKRRASTTVTGGD